MHITHASRLVVGALFRTSVLAVPMALAGVVAGCGVVYQPAKVQGTKSAAAPHVAGSPLEVVSENGGITVTRTPGDEVRVTAAIRAQTQARLDGTTVSLERREDGTLAVRVNWPGGTRDAGEGADLQVSLPDALGLTLRTHNGAISTGGLGGPADLRSSNGAVTVQGHAGPVAAHTSNGRIELYDVPSAQAETSNGRVVVRLTAEGEGPVTIDTSNGAVTLEVGPAFDAVLTASTSNGGVTCSATGARTVASGRGHGSYTFGGGRHACKVRSSNGGITISNRP